MDRAVTDGKIFNKSVTVNAPKAAVWAALTEPTQMQQWMAESPIDIITNWQVGHPIRIRGHLHQVTFENSGTVLQVEPAQLLQYTHLSSLSRLPERPESYSILEFRLDSTPAPTTLTLTVRNFPTEAIYKHLAFYWTVALEMLKKKVEQSARVASI